MGKKTDAASGMRHRITFQTESLTPDGGGGATLSWSNGSTVWASIEEQSGRNLSSEKIYGGQLQERSAYRFTTRYLSGITPKMRILFGSRTFNIRSVFNVGEKSEILEIFAEEGVAL